jgi:leucyl aminopeptidase
MPRCCNAAQAEQARRGNDHCSPPQGQGNVKGILPPKSRIAVRSGRYAPSERALARTDAVVFVLDSAQAEPGLRSLPHAELWRSLRGAAGDPRGKPPVLATRLPNANYTRAAAGFARRDMSGFERLALAGKLVQAALDPGVRSLRVHVVDLEGSEAEAWLDAIASAALAAAAPMPDRRSKPDPSYKLQKIELAGSAPGLRQTLATSEGNHLARWLATLPPNELDSVSYRRALQRLARTEDWQFEFLDERALRRLGAGAFLAVARANGHRGAGIVRLGYRPRGRKRQPSLALVGKGICFDTGGINLKTAKGMFLMHGDMQGSAVAVGTLLALTRMQADFAVDCWVALTENEIGPRAYRPQEIVRASNGVTIQVVHSDAEGRMVLADTLALAARRKPALMIDFATLTGACVNALTERYSGAFTNRPELHAALVEAGRRSGERVWCFPMDEDYDRDLDSPIADLMQCATEGKGDHILAARFLGRFVPQAMPWVHVDLSSSERKGGLAHVPTEFTGFGVRFATELLGDGSLLARAGATK